MLLLKQTLLDDGIIDELTFTFHYASIKTTQITFYKCYNVNLHFIMLLSKQKLEITKKGRELYLHFIMLLLKHSNGQIVEAS